MKRSWEDVFDVFLQWWLGIFIVISLIAILIMSTCVMIMIAQTSFNLIK